MKKRKSREKKTHMALEYQYARIALDWLRSQSRRHSPADQEYLHMRSVLNNVLESWQGMVTRESIQFDLYMDVIHLLHGDAEPEMQPYIAANVLQLFGMYWTLRSDYLTLKRRLENPRRFTDAAFSFGENQEAEDLI